MKKTLRRCTAGVAMIEFAILLPVLLVLLVGTIEVSRYALINLKVDKAANAMADIATLGSRLCESDFDRFAAAATQILRPFEFGGSVIFTSVVAYNQPGTPCVTDGAACISWQRQPLGSDPSSVGTSGGSPELPGDYTVPGGLNVITAEIFYNYSPMLDITGSLVPPLGAHKIFKIGVYKPRLRNLGEIPSGSCGA